MISLCMISGDDCEVQLRKALCEETCTIWGKTLQWHHKPKPLEELEHDSIQ